MNYHNYINDNYFKENGDLLKTNSELIQEHKRGSTVTGYGSYLIEVDGI